MFSIGCSLSVKDVTGEELLSRMASSLAGLPAESPAFCQISGASYGYLKQFTLSDDGARVCTIINPTVNGEPLIPEKTYRMAFCGVPDEMNNPEPVISTMEEAAEAMGEYLKSGEAVILPDIPVPDQRIVPMDEIPADAVVYEIKPETANDKAA